MSPRPPQRRPGATARRRAGWAGPPSSDDEAGWNRLHLVAMALDVPSERVLVRLVWDAYEQHCPQWASGPGDGLPTQQGVWQAAGLPLAPHQTLWVPKTRSWA